MNTKLIFLSFYFFLLVPFLNAAIPNKTVNAVDYGLKEGIDNTPALIRALDACKTHNAEKLIIPKGIYDVFPQKANEMYRHITNNDDGLKRIVFLLHQMDGLEIDGMGSKLICHDHMIPFDLHQANNITIRNLFIDWSMPFYFQAKVIAVHPEENAFDLEVFEECQYEIHGDELIFTNNKNKGSSEWLKMAPPAQEDVRWEQNINWNIWWDPQTKAPVFSNEGATRLHRWNTKLGVPATAMEIGNDKVRLFNATSTLPEPGWVLIIKGKLQKNRLSPAIHITQSKDIEINNVTVHHSSGIALIVERTENILLNSYNVLLPPGSGRLVSTTADATHFLNCKGLIKFENCVFENMLDDATNVHGAYANVHDATDEFTVGMTRGHSQQQGIVFAEKGDRIKLVNRESLMPYATLTVESVKNINSFYFEVSFKEKIRDILQKETLADNLTWQPDVEMRNCMVRNNRARSILISTAGDVLIENNKFTSCTYTGIMIAGSSDFWYESGPVQNVIIRKNLFEDMGLSSGNAPVLDIAGSLGNATQPPFYLHKNILFENNTINTFGRLLLRAKSVENFKILNNKINRSANYPVIVSGEGPAFIFDRCKDVLIRNNDYQWSENATIESIHSRGLKVERNNNIQK